MEYHKFTDEEVSTWIERCAPETKVKYSKSRVDTPYYVVNMFGMTPRLWQTAFWDILDKGRKRVIVCTPRQIGKTVAVSAFALRAVDMNIRRAGVGKHTHIGIISASEEQSKKVLLEIRRLMQIGDKYVEKSTNGKMPEYFTGKLDKSQSATNNKSTLTFKNGNQIISLPPTDRVRGYTFSYVFVDEAAFLDDDNLFFDVVVPTVKDTDGVICLTSTPNGQRGFFFDIFDPFDNQPDHDYHRLWLNYKDLRDETVIERIESEKDLYYRTGREKKFEQEYEAKFTVQTSAFFDSDDVDNMFSEDLFKQDKFEEECDCSIDFGMVHSHTVITVSRVNKDDEIERLYHHQYEFGKDDNIVEDLLALKERFNIQRFIPDDCPQGYHTIQKMKELGWNVKEMNFRRDKVAKYNEFRSRLRQSRVKSYKDRILEVEMKALQEEETVKNTKIHKPSGGTDDMIDSFVMSCYFFLENKEKGFRVYNLDEVEV